MSRFTNTLSLFLASIPLLAGRSYAAVGPDTSAVDNDKKYEPVSLRPLNFSSDNLFASHRSHSSHASHASHSSHYSGSGRSTSYSAPRAPDDTPLTATPAPAASPGSSGANTSVLPRTAPGSQQNAPAMTVTEKRMLQIMRVQIALTRLELYHGQISGTLDEGTKSSLKMFQRIKGLLENGLMTTETMNGLGVTAVQ